MRPHHVRAIIQIWYDPCVRACWWRSAGMIGSNCSGRVVERVEHRGMTDQERIAELEAEIAQQREQIATLLERVRDLEARLAKDSHNSSKPPASDGLKRQLPRTRSLRRKTGKKPGGQLGHPGETLHLLAEPDAVVAHRPTVCSACQTSLADVEATAVVTSERRQVQDLPPILQ
jgi:transposase